MQSKHAEQRKEIYISKNGKSLIFVEKQTNLYYLRAKVVNEVSVANYTTDDVNAMIKDETKYINEKILTFHFQTMNINDAHHKYGHHGEARLRGIAKIKGSRLVGNLTECDACGVIKAKVASIPHTIDHVKKASDIGERLFVDISGPFQFTTTKWHRDVRNKLY